MSFNNRGPLTLLCEQQTFCIWHILLSMCLWMYHFTFNLACFSAGCGPDSSVGIATAYGLDGPGIESRWGRDFSHLSRPALRPTQPPVQWVPGLSRG
jgi:hypothetical protein